MKNSSQEIKYPQKLILKSLSIKIIAEIGSNWEGDVELGKLHIKKAKQSGASHIKFQMWKAKDLYKPSFKYWEDVKKSELTETDAKELKNYADKIGIHWFCSVFYPEAVDILESLDVKIYKIASLTLSLKHKFAYETIKHVAETKKFTFISTGFGVDHRKIEKLFQTDNYQYCYCISDYPASDDKIDWNRILKFNFFSDHTLGITIPIVFLSLKRFFTNADLYVEKHVKLDHSKGPDSQFSIHYSELTDLVNHSKRIDKIPSIGTNKKLMINTKF